MSKPQTLESITAIVSRITYRDWTFNVFERNGDPKLQITFMAADLSDKNPEPYLQHCRVWDLSYHMCDTEIFDACVAAAERAMLHEFKEEFLFDGVRILNPHTSVWAQLQIAKLGLSVVDARDNRQTESQTVELFSTINQE